MLSHNESRKITVTDRQKNGQTDIRTNRRTRALGQKRCKTDKTEAETRSRRQQTRINRQDGRHGRWCGMVHTATRRWVVVWWSCCVVACCWWCKWLCVVVRIACLCLSCWGLVSGGRLPTPGCPRHRGATLEDSTGQGRARLACSMFILVTNANNFSYCALLQKKRTFSSAFEMNQNENKIRKKFTSCVSSFDFCHIPSSRK